MENEKLATALETASLQIDRNDPDPLMRPMVLTPAFAKSIYQAMFRGMAYYLRFKVDEAKASPCKKYGLYIKALDHFVFGAYISILDSEGEDSVTLDFTYNEADFADMIAADAAIDIDNVINMHQYINSACRACGGSDNDVKSFHILPEAMHSVFILGANVLRHYIESLLDDKSSDATVTYSGIFTAVGSFDNDGNKVIYFDLDELIKQLIKNDDSNAVQQ